VDPRTPAPRIAGREEWRRELAALRTREKALTRQLGALAAQRRQLPMVEITNLHARDVTLVLVSRAPLADLVAYRARMGWTLPWYSSHGSDFNDDFEATVDGEEQHGVSVFLRQGDRVFQTYATGRRGVEHLGSHWTYLDLTPYGRQEIWEHSPDGWPQTEPYGWLRRHDEYER
jgi:predicted dithiol-disulfide oxidoreductase (DUF899 family)